MYTAHTIWLMWGSGRSPAEYRICTRGPKNQGGRDREGRKYGLVGVSELRRACAHVISNGCVVHVISSARSSVHMAVL
jgi:hypothetical protein